MKTKRNAVERATAEKIAAEIRLAADAILKKHGLQVYQTHTQFGDHFQFKIAANAVTLGRNGVNLTSKEAQFFAMAAHAVGLVTSDLGATFDYLGQPMTLLGMRNSAKNPYLVRNEKDGKNYWLPESEVVLAAIKAVR